MSDTMPGREQRQALCAAPVTLDGERAKVTGYDLPFARVRNVRTGVGFEWAWSTVVQIVDNGGAFHS